MDGDAGPAAEDGPAPGAEAPGAVFAFFNEIGIISQLSSALFQKRLPDGVTVAQFSILNHLIRVRDGQTPLTLAIAFQAPKTTMTHSLAGLEKRGLVEMRANPKDGRSKCVWLTDAGRAFREAAIGALAEDAARLAPQLDIRAVMEMIPKLAEVRAVLDRDRDQPDRKLSSPVRPKP